MLVDGVKVLHRQGILCSSEFVEVNVVYLSRHLELPPLKCAHMPAMDESSRYVGQIDIQAPLPALVNANP
jgi:hypothetical protein